jgi:pimeloyl-ACP methyl ester carboxylesterase
MADARFDHAVGRYVHLDLGGIAHRVYFEESGSGIPLLLQHTAGADGRQWRHVLEDSELRTQFRLIAYDLPYHGKSVPPTNRRVGRRVSVDAAILMSVPITLSHALGLERPVYMGSSIGGHLAIDLAIEHPNEFRAVVGLEASAQTPGGFVDEFYHPAISNDFKAHLMYGLTAPMSPEQYRHETLWVYSQGAPQFSRAITLLG